MNWKIEWTIPPSSEKILYHLKTLFLGLAWGNEHGHMYKNIYAYIHHNIPDISKTRNNLKVQKIV